MSQSQFTKGPWMVVPDTNSRIPDAIFKVVGESEVVNGFDGICTPCKMNDRSFDEDKANMQLIAAAPELYEALQIAEAFIGEFDTIDGEESFTLTIINKALSKARGE